MKPNDKKDFLKFVSSVKFPDRYASNIARCVNIDGGKFNGLKSHDCHLFMQHLLPVGTRHLLPKDVVKPNMLLSRFFSQLRAKTLRKTDINQLRHDIVKVLCKVKMIFPPAFFKSTIHMMVHLPEEALLAGPVNYHWMYPIERYIILIICLCILIPLSLKCIISFYFGKLLEELKKLYATGRTPNDQL
ncbi:unnamed protein product [Prunus armeniaca]